MSWSIHPIIEFKNFCEDWQNIVREHYTCHPLLDTKFVEPLVRNFGNTNLRLGVEKIHGDIYSIVLLKYKSWAVAETFSPSQAPVLLAVTRRIHDYAISLQELLRTMPGYIVILGMQKYDSGYFTAITPENNSIESIDYVPTISVEISGGFNTYWSTRSKNLRRNITRYTNRLKKARIEWELEEITDAKQMQHAVSCYGDIESSGWKGERGTAIHRENTQGRFYTEVLTRFSRSGGGKVFNLYFNDVLVSSRLVIIQNGILVILKTTYDESYSKYAPGRLLLYVTLKRIFDGAYARKVEFYTNASPDQMQWSTDSRMISHVNIYRTVSIRLLINTIKSVRNRAHLLKRMT